DAAVFAVGGAAAEGGRAPGFLDVVHASGRDGNTDHSGASGCVGGGAGDGPALPGADQLQPSAAGRSTVRGESGSGHVTAAGLRASRGETISPDNRAFRQRNHNAKTDLVPPCPARPATLEWLRFGESLQVIKGERLQIPITPAA